MTGLVDCNNFFVSCERTLNPGLIGCPVVVMSNNDGCVVARSNEAKALGVKMGQPVFEIRKLIDSGQLVALSGNHLLYKEISIRVHEIFRRYVPSSLDYSCDEAFLDVTGIPPHALIEIGEEIRQTCLDEVKIPVTIGFAPTRALSKILTDISKKKNQHVSLITDFLQLESHFKVLPVNELWGIGRRLYKRMFREGVFTIWDFILKDKSWVKQRYGINGERLWLELRGTSCIDLSCKERELQQSISETRTFPFDVADFDWIKARITIYASSCARKLRQMKGECQNVGVFLATNVFHQEKGGYFPFLSNDLSEPTADTTFIVKTAQQILSAIYHPEFSYKRAGVILNEIVPEGSFVPSLFESPSFHLFNHNRSKSLLSAIDSINKTAHTPVIKLASQITPDHPGHNDGFSISFHAPGKNS